MAARTFSSAIDPKYEEGLNKLIALKKKYFGSTIFKVSDKDLNLD